MSLDQIIYGKTKKREVKQPYAVARIESNVASDIIERSPVPVKFNTKRDKKAFLDFLAKEVSKATSKPKSTTTTEKSTKK